MIVPLTCLVDDLTFERVKNICGEEVALQLCCEDQETADAVKEMVGIILNGTDHVRQNRSEVS